MGKFGQAGDDTNQRNRYTLNAFFDRSAVGQLPNDVRHEVNHSLRQSGSSAVNRRASLSCFQ